MHIKVSLVINTTKQKFPAKAVRNIKICIFTFSHPDYTVGAGLTPARHIIVFVGYTTGMELHHSPKIILSFFENYEKRAALTSRPSDITKC